MAGLKDQDIEHEKKFSATSLRFEIPTSRLPWTDRGNENTKSLKSGPRQK